MRTLTGALLLLGAEQAYAHANLIQFPNQVEARTILLPAAMTFLVLGALTLIWGMLTENRNRQAPDSPLASAASKSA